MKARRRVIGDAMMAAGSMLALGLGLTLLDSRVRTQIGLLFNPQNPAATLVGLGERATDVVAMVAAVARAQTFGHAPLVIFAVAAALLTLFMLRT